jgi:hypothetical protein
MPSLSDAVTPLLTVTPMPTLDAAKTALDTYLLPEPVEMGDPVPSDAPNGSALWESKATVAGTTEASTVAEAAAALVTLSKDAARLAAAATSLNGSVTAVVGTYVTDVAALAALLVDNEAGLGTNRLAGLKEDIAELLGQGDVSVVDTELASLVDAEAAEFQAALTTGEAALISAEGRLAVARLALQVALSNRDRVQAAVTARARAARSASTSTLAAVSAASAAIDAAAGLQDQLDAYAGQIAALGVEIDDLEVQLTAEPDPGTPTAVLLASWIAERTTEVEALEETVTETEGLRLFQIRAAVIAYRDALDGRARLTNVVDVSTWDPHYDVDASDAPATVLASAWTAASTAVDLAQGAYVASQLAHRQAVIGLAEARAAREAWLLSRGEDGSDLSDALDAAIGGL